MAAAAKAAPANTVEAAHQLYRDSQYDEALELYTEALSTAKTRVHRIALHSNRAACYLKLHDFKKAADECTSVLELDNKHTGALMLRAQTLVALKEYQFALFDVNRLLDINPSSEVYMELQSRLKTQLSLAPIPEVEEEEEEEEKWKEEPKGGNELKMAEEAQQRDHALANISQNNIASSTNKSVAPSRESQKESSMNRTVGWQAIPKPKGHSKLDYSRWDAVENDSSEDDEDEDSDDEDSHPQYRFRVKV